MQISTTKRPQILKDTSANTKADGAAQQEQQQTETPKDGFMSTVKSEAFGNARHFSNRVSNGVGKAGGVIGASVGAAAALSGGAIIGMAAGAAVASPISTLFSSGGFDFIKTGLSAVGMGGQIGIGLGLVTLAAGGWVVGDKVAGTAAKAIAYPVGLATGAVTGTMRHLGTEAGALPPVKREEKAEKPDIVSEKNKFMQGTQWVLTGAGGLTGLAGGATLGLGIGAGIEAVSSLLSGDFSAAATTSAALTGALIGGGAGFTVGAVGGYAISDKIHAGVNGIAEGARISQKLLEQDKRGNLMDELRDRLENDKSDFADEQKAGAANISKRESSLQGRSETLAKNQQSLDDKILTEADLTQGRSDELYTNENQRLSTYEGRLDDDKAHLDSEKVRLTGKEGDIDNLIREEATNRRETHRNNEQNTHDVRKGNLESREDKLQTKETNINTIANDKVQKELQPLRNQASNDRSDAASNRNQASNLRSEASRLEGQVSGILSEARSLDSRASSQESSNHSLRSEASSLSSRESRLSSDLSSCQAEKRRKERNGGGSGHKDGGKWPGNGGGGAGHKDGNKWG